MLSVDLHGSQVNELRSTRHKVGSFSHATTFVNISAGFLLVWIFFFNRCTARSNLFLDFGILIYTCVKLVEPNNHIYRNPHSIFSAKQNLLLFFRTSKIESDIVDDGDKIQFGRVCLFFFSRISTFTSPKTHFYV